MTTLDDQGVLEVVEESSAESGQVRFRQSMMREVAYDSLSRVDRRARHLAAAASLEEDPSDVGGAFAGVIAQHLLDALRAGGPDEPGRAELVVRIRELLIAAADRSEALGDPQQALASIETALELDPGPVERAGLLKRAAETAYASGNPEKALTVAQEAEGRYRDLGDVPGVVAAMTLQTWTMFTAGRLQEAQQLAEHALELAAGRDDVPAAVLLKIHSTLSHCARAAGDLREQQRHAWAGLALAEKQDDPILVVSPLLVLGTALTDSGCVAAAAAVYQSCARLARAGHDLRTLGTTLGYLCSERYPRDLAEGATLAVEAMEVYRQVGNVSSVGVGLINASYARWLLGDWDRLVQENAEWLADQGTTAASSSLWLMQAQVRRARGEPVTVPEIRQSEDPYDQHAAALAHALADAAAGGLPAAARAAGEATLSRIRSGQGDVGDDLALLLPPAVELLCEAGDAEAARTLMDAAEPVLTGLRHRLATAELARLRGLVALANGTDPEEPLRAAEQALADYGAPYLLARTRLELGRWLAHQGRLGEAQPLLTQARQVFELLGAVPSTAEVDDLALVPTVSIMAAVGG